MSDQSDKWEEGASQAISDRNYFVKQGWDAQGTAINKLEEKAANYLSKAKSIRQARRG